MSESLKKQFTNDTLEEELRVMLVDKNNECNALRAKVKILEATVAEEQEAKYRAYIKIADMQKNERLSTSK
jgi:hypothetical protein|tara:strand:+ start:175 stop:387 length:213 start_codon:yes stop_codon:yes gene_type:complete